MEDLVLILPSKRAGGFLKNYLLQTTEQTSFAPKIISIEEFIEELSGLKIIHSVELLFKSYQAYKNCKNIPEKEDFESFSSWSTALINDFNEIDRYLVDTDRFFRYLNSIKTLEKWNSQNEQTTLIENYLQFWNQLPEFYDTLKDNLLNEGVGYQGLVYRKAAEDIEHYVSREHLQNHIFIGFNILNNAEQHIIQELLETGLTSIYWDMDAFFYSDEKHSASYFLRKYQKEWKLFSKASSFNTTNHYIGEKNIKLVEVQKNIGQAKYVGHLLESYSQEELDQTAIVLADESLLQPVLNSLPKNILSVNITMGVPLRSFPGAIFFEILLHLHQKSTEMLYFKDVLAILNHPLVSLVLDKSQEIMAKMKSQNSTHITLQQLKDLSGDSNNEVIDLLFGDWQNKSEHALHSCLQLLLIAKERCAQHSVERVILFKLFTIFKKIESLNLRFSHINTITSIHRLYLDLISRTPMEFEGDTYKGLQIMGVHETRVLDFENIIMLSVNEGILPSGKSNSSFITYDLKHEFGLPLYNEKDAVYTYHFYRLLQRARNIVLCYNTHSEGLNSGEKSRFILQLEIDSQPLHTIERVVVNPPVRIIAKEPKNIAKTSEVMERIKEIAKTGFSPSSLTNYIRNPIDFYYQKVLRIDESQEIEETVAYNTLGTIVHDTLQEFYEPLIGKFLTVEALKNLKSAIEKEISRQFKKTFRQGNFSTGKNLIIFEVAKRFISNFIDYEINEVKKGNKIKILNIESDLNVQISSEEIDFPIRIRGKVDRVDEYNGTLRIIDYKTGLVKQGDLEIVDWNLITQDYKYSKAVQVLAYALMIQNDLKLTAAEAGIISFKNLNSGFLKFGTKETKNSKTKDQTVTPEILDLFIVELKKLILEICDPETPFIEKEIA